MTCHSNHTSSLLPYVYIFPVQESYSIEANGYGGRVGANSNFGIFGTWNIKNKELEPCNCNWGKLNIDKYSIWGSGI